jgi:hypothetical protein
VFAVAIDASNGEQSVRDRFDTQTECRNKGLSVRDNPFDILECLMPKKLFAIIFSATAPQNNISPFFPILIAIKKNHVYLHPQNGKDLL